MKFLSKWIAMAILLALLSPLTVQVYAEEEAPADTALQNVYYKAVNEVVYAVAGVNIRTGPSTDDQIIGVLRRGKSIRRMAIGSDGWSKVMYGDQVAYIHSSYLTTHRPDGSAVAPDDQELMRQIAIANGLNQMDYTTQSWERVTSAMDDACSALDEGDQIAVDAAAKLLKDAIAALVRMDYTVLESALAEMQALGKENITSALWLELMEAGRNGESLLTSGDQAAVDAAAKQLQGLLVQLEEQSGSHLAPEVVIQEVPVEVPPSEDYCNIAMHRGWQVLFFVSAAVNVFLAVVILVYLSKKKRKQRDNTPLVNYNIFDDTV